MAEIHLSEEGNVDTESECLFNDISSIRNCFRLLHSHDFPEILIVVSGSFINHVNGCSTTCGQGSVIFFRPADVHRIDPDSERECHLINLTYRLRTLLDLFAYLGENPDQCSLLKAEVPPTIVLTAAQLRELLSRLDALNRIPRTEKSRTRAAMRAILMDLYYNYIYAPVQNRPDNCPDWLAELCQTMQVPDRFCGSAAAMAEISGKTHAYLCRSFRRHLQTTPVAYLNHLRLDYARNLLLNSDRSILDICGEIGFSSLGHFYRLFTRRFGSPPLQYRQANWQSPHPYPIN